MNYSKFIVSNQKEGPISIRRVKACSRISHFCDGMCSYIVHTFYVFVCGWQQRFRIGPYMNLESPRQYVSKCLMTHNKNSLFNDCLWCVDGTKVSDNLQMFLKFPVSFIRCRVFYVQPNDCLWYVDNNKGFISLL